MSQATEGRPASDHSPCLAPDHIQLRVFVRSSCIEEGYNAAGDTILAVNVGQLRKESRRTLRRLIDDTRKSMVEIGMDISDRNGVIDLTRAVGIFCLSLPTVGDLEDKLGALGERYETTRSLGESKESLDGLLREAVVDVLLTHPDGVGNFRFDWRAKSIVLSREIADAAVGRLTEAFDAEFERMDRLDRRRRADMKLGEKPVVSAREWATRQLGSNDPLPYMSPGAPEEHLSMLSFMRGWYEKEHAQERYERSPKGMVERLLKEKGTASQVERWREGMLPDAETDAVVAAHLFEETLAGMRPETRLDRDIVVEALKGAVPGASVTKVAFATEEAAGLDEEEWAAFKAVRNTLPRDAVANVVRTVVNIQTASHGPYLARRALATLKGTFAEREVRLRIDLGTGLRVVPA